MSQQAQSADTTAAAPASVKRTPAQREKKRAQDRQSQRNVRNRTKQYIANLEAKVNELSSYEGLSHLIAANESLQAQNDNLITALRSIATLVEKVCDSAAASSKVAAEASARAAAEKKTVTERRQKFGSWTSPATSPEAHGNDDNDGVTSAFERVSFDGRHHTQRVHSVVVPTSPRSQEKQAELRHSSRQASTANTKNGTEHNLRTYSMHSGSMDSQAGHEPYLPPHMAFDDTWARPMAVSSGADSGMLWEASCLPTAPSATAHMMLLDSESDVCANHWYQVVTLVGPMTSLPYEPTSSYSNSELSHSLVSQICAPTNVWDAKLFAFIRLHRSSRLIQTDKSTLEPTFPNVDILVYPNRPSAAADPITRFLADAINAWNFDIPERLGVFWLNYIFLKVCTQSVVQFGEPQGR